MGHAGRAGNSAAGQFDADGIPRRTDISSLSAAHEGLSYRGYLLRDCVAHGSYEQIALLLLTGELPSRAQHNAFLRQIRAARALPLPVRRMLESLPRTAHPMEVLRTGVSLLGTLTPEQGAGASGAGTSSDSARTASALCAHLLGAMPSLLLYWRQFHAPRRAGKARRLATADNVSGVAQHFLRLLHGQPGTRAARAAPAGAQSDAASARRLEQSLLVYAEHVINASSFTARVITSTGGDYYSAIVGALGALSGPAHGGANEDVLRTLKTLRSVAVAERKLLALLKQGERVPGFGHRVYRDVDPRSVAHRELSAQQAAANDDTRLHDVAIAAEQLMRAQKNLPSNVDLYAATLYDALGIEASLFTPLFAIARLPGWTAHIFEQRQSARLMQPTLIESDLPPRGWPVTH